MASPTTPEGRSVRAEAKEMGRFKGFNTRLGQWIT